ncbi:hypothetical protein [Aquibacillus rhizosphaerae]|uniref:DUF2569 domain-containing protein n=1 Tax=Aquibacillus rhizosphaerae TaxID=3051431 RepID=A0ABT7LAK4_9BACI|nr:hypothetical protein [Aquibacillus sp. LR5S19]MDL4842893.1 hypothetical protein [Aquibacillus sp. LR5S19]
MAFKSLFAGTVAGLILAIFLFVIEWITGNRVYTLLMNVDFVINDIPLILEWLLHMTISWGISLIFVVLIRMKTYPSIKIQWSIVCILSGLASLSYFPLTIIAKKETPSVLDMEAIFYWLIGHILYAIIFMKVFRSNVKIGCR